MTETDYQLPGFTLQFINEYQGENRGVLQGLLSLNPSLSQLPVNYIVRWGRTPKQPIAGASYITHFLSNTQQTAEDEQKNFHPLLQFTFSQQQIPEGATCLLLYCTTERNDLENAAYDAAAEILLAFKQLFAYPSLLAPNATALESQLACTSARLTELPIRLAQLWDIDQCPPAFLPWLAWGVSIDSWLNFDDTNESGDQQQRQADLENYRRRILRSNSRLQQHKGTLASLEAALAALGLTIQIREWWQDYDALSDTEKQQLTPAQWYKQNTTVTPFHFQIEIDPEENPLFSPAEIEQIVFDTIDQIKPVRSRFTTAFEMKVGQLRLPFAVSARTVHVTHGESRVQIPAIQAASAGVQNEMLATSVVNLTSSDEA